MSDAHYPPELLYHPEHDWARLDDDCAEFGITWYAQDALGEIVFVQAPDIGTAVAAGEPYAEIESVKSVSDVVAPLSGEVVEVNAHLTEQPDLLNTDPYGHGWIARVRLTEPAQVDRLLSGERYQETLR